MHWQNHARSRAGGKGRQKGEGKEDRKGEGLYEYHAFI